MERERAHPVGWDVKEKARGPGVIVYCKLNRQQDSEESMALRRFKVYPERDMERYIVDLEGAVFDILPLEGWNC